MTRTWSSFVLKENVSNGDVKLRSTTPTDVYISNNTLGAISEYANEHVVTAANNRLDAKGSGACFDGRGGGDYLVAGNACANSYSDDVVVLQAREAIVSHPTGKASVSAESYVVKDMLGFESN